MAATATALTIVERVEKSPAIAMLDSRAQGLLDLLPDAAAATRFRRVVIQALAKNPDLLECTAESVVLSVFEAATQGLEPTGAAGGAHLVPYNVKVSKNPDRYEKRAQLIPDYRGVIRLVTQPHDERGRPVASDVAAIEAEVVKEGDEFSYTRGTDASVHHVPSLAPDRSSKATTHVYVVARLKNGERIPTVMDRTDIERIRGRGKRGEAFSPWATDWDEMARKTVIKRAAKTLPVHPVVRSILVREDDGLDDDVTPAAVEAPKAGTKATRLAQRLKSVPAAEEAAQDDIIDGEATELDAAADVGLTRDELLAGLDAAEISRPFAVERAKALFPDRGDAELSPVQRKKLLDDLVAEKDAAAL